MLIKKSKRKIIFLKEGGGGGASEIRQTWGGACPKRLKTPGLDYWSNLLGTTIGPTSWEPTTRLLIQPVENHWLHYWSYKLGTKTRLLVQPFGNHNYTFGLGHLGREVTSFQQFEFLFWFLMDWTRDSAIIPSRWCISWSSALVSSLH